MGIRSWPTACFSANKTQVDAPNSLENVETKWVAEIAENCPGVKLVLVALKCDLRASSGDDDDESNEPKRPMIEYKQGLEVAQRIRALRYLGTCSSLDCSPTALLIMVPVNWRTTDQRLECSAMKNRGVNEAFTEAARVALSVKTAKGDKDSKCAMM